MRPNICETVLWFTVRFFFFKSPYSLGTPVVAVLTFYEFYTALSLLFEFIEPDGRALGTVSHLFRNCPAAEGKYGNAEETQGAPTDTHAQSGPARCLVSDGGCS